MKIVKNMLLEHTGTAEFYVERVLWLSHDLQQVILFPLNDPKALPYETNAEEVLARLAAGELKPIESDPYVSIEGPLSAAPGHVKRLESAWACIEAIVNLPREGAYIPSERGAAIRQAVSANGVSKVTIYRYLRQYWQGGQRKNALLPRYKNCGARGKVRVAGESKRGRPRVISEGKGINIGDQERENFAKGYKAFYENPENANKPTFRDAFERTLGRFFHRGLDVGPDGKLSPALPPAHELPTIRQFTYWYQRQRDLKKSLIAREGQRRHDLKFRGLGGDAASIALGPGSVYQIDSTKADIYLVSSFDRSKVVGRATIYLVVDVFSGMIVGFDASLESPSYHAAALAIENAASDKVAYCLQSGINISADEWPSQHLPDALWADRGEMISKFANHLTDGLNIRVCNVPPYRADLKPFVERVFRTVNDAFIHKLPGAVVKRHERGDRDPRLEAKLTLGELREGLIRYILFFNRSRIEGRRPRDFMITDNVEPRPTALWEWGIQNRSGHLHQLPADLLRVHLLPGGEATVTGKGILFKRLYYGCESAVRKQWNTQARVRGTWKVPVAFDPRRAEILYLRSAKTNEIEPCTLLASDQFHAGRSWKEVESYFTALAQQKDKSLSSDLQRTVNHNIVIDSLVATAEASTAKAQTGESKRARIASIRKNRQEERDRDREGSIADISISEEVPGNVVPLEMGAPIVVPISEGNVPKSSNIELLRKQRDKKRPDHYGR